MNIVTSSDGTPIAFARDGAGDPLILVGGAFSYRRYPGQVRLAELLSARFTVYSYDRAAAKSWWNARAWRSRRSLMTRKLVTSTWEYTRSSCLPSHAAMITADSGHWNVAAGALVRA